MPDERTLVTLHLNTERTFRGGEVQTLGLVRLLTRKGHRAILLAREGGPLLERALAAGVEAFPWSPRGEWDLASALRLHRFLVREEVDLIHAHTAHALTLALVARGPRSVPKVVASRRVSFPLRGPLSKAKYGRADAVVAVSGPIRDALVADGLDPAKVRVVHSGVDLSRFMHLPDRAAARRALAIPPQKLVVGVVGALVGHKGHGHFLSAFNRLWVEVPQAFAVFVGDGRNRAVLEHQAAAGGLPVRFAGEMAEPAPVYPAFDMLVLPSRSGEGSPGVIKEAAAAGVPVVATNLSGTSEILRDGEEALLVPPEDSGVMARAMLRLAADPELRRALAARARVRVEEFSLEATAERTWEVYLDLLGPAEARRGLVSAQSRK